MLERSVDYGCNHWESSRKAIFDYTYWNVVNPRWLISWHWPDNLGDFITIHVRKIELISHWGNCRIRHRWRKIKIAFISKWIDLVNSNLANRRKEPIKIVCDSPVIFAKWSQAGRLFWNKRSNSLPQLAWVVGIACDLVRSESALSWSYFSLDVIPKVFIGGPSIRFTCSSCYLSPPVPRFHELSDLVSYVRAKSSSNLDFFDWRVRPPWPLLFTKSDPCDRSLNHMW